MTGLHAALRGMGMAGLAAFLLISAPPAHARKKAPPLPPPTAGLIDNVNGIAPRKDGFLQRFTGLLIDSNGRVERRLAAGEKRPEFLLYRMDAKGRTLIPSLVDGHAHVIAAGIRLMTLDLSETRSLAEAQAKIAAYARENAGRKWILGGGWDAKRWGMEGQPTAAQLDASVADTPAWLLSADGRAGWANSAALRLVGLNVGSKGAGAVLTGGYKVQMERIVPTPAPKDRDIALDKAQRWFMERGISTVADMGTDILDWQAYRRAGDRGALRIRIIGYADGIENMSTIAGSSPTPWLYEDRLRLAGVHLPVGSGADITRLNNQASRAAMDGFQLALTPESEADMRTTANVVREMSATYTGDRRWRQEPVEARPPSFRWLSIGAPRLGDIGNGLAEITSRRAHSAFAETRIGSLQPGQWADFLLIDRDISTASPDEIAATKILEHWIGGKRAWTSAEAQ